MHQVLQKTDSGLECHIFLSVSISIRSLKSQIRNGASKETDLCDTLRTTSMNLKLRCPPGDARAGHETPGAVAGSGARGFRQSHRAVSGRAVPAGPGSQAAGRARHRANGSVRSRRTTCCVTRRCTKASCTKSVFVFAHTATVSLSRKNLLGSKKNSGR